ncbi:unnamed protein product [Rodentolepis nana]|uniref:Uncharacterized protein n=1 Tax=Rodentolepis nana TaxID=102285 RepID=A0A0R3TPV4_RODNA|nr:unnamed protein product [Rodentolepis nana]
MNVRSVPVAPTNGSVSSTLPHPITVHFVADWWRHKCKVLLGMRHCKSIRHPTLHAYADFASYFGLDENQDYIDMASHNSFDNQASALLDRHQQSPNAQPPPSSSPNFLGAGSSPIVFSQPALNLNLLRSMDDNPNSPPIPPHQTASIGSALTTVGAVLRSAVPPTNSAGCVLIDRQPQPIEAVQNLVSQLREEIAIRDAQIARLTGEVKSLRRLVGDRNRDVDQLRSVLDQKYIPANSTNHASTADPIIDGNITTGVINEFVDYGEGRSIQIPLVPSPQPQVQGPPARIKKQGVCGESVSRNANIGFVHYEKDHNKSRHVTTRLFYLGTIVVRIRGAKLDCIHRKEFDMQMGNRVCFVHLSKCLFWGHDSIWGGASVQMIFADEKRKVTLEVTVF